MSSALRHILVVDDDEVDREVFQRALSRPDLGLCVHEAGSVHEMRSMLASQNFDCVLLDYHLGEALGVELMPEIVAHRAEICPIILVTLREAEDIIVEAMRRGATDYLAKRGMDAARLVTVVLSALNRAAEDQARLDRETQLRDSAEALRQEHEKALRAALQEAQSGNIAKNQFCANMSHEIRTPLNAILGIAHLLERTALDEQQTDMVDKIQVAGKALLSVINDVLDITKLDAGLFQLSHAPFDLRAMLRSIQQLAEVQIGESVVAFGLQIDGDPPAMLVGDAGRVHQILLNLVTNAVKFTENGRVDLMVMVAEDTPGGPLRLRFEVRDTGLGIAQDMLAHLFMPFVQADASTARRFGGTGLGLSISRELVELMQGQIGVSSQLGRGSTFWVELPFGRWESATLPSPDASGDPPPLKRLSGLRILLVDDSEINLEVAGSILTAEGASVRTAANGAQAVHQVIARPGHFDVILLDLQMPVVDGYEAFRQIDWTLGPSRPAVIALTAGASPSEAAETSLSRMEGMVIKPFEVDQLVHTIRRVTDRQALLQATRQEPLKNGVETWPVIPGIDVEDVCGRLGGNLALFLRSLRKMAEEYADLDAESIDPDGNGGEVDALQRRLHKLKGNAGLLGITALHTQAAEAESCLSEGLLPHSKTLLRNIEHQIKELRHHLERLEAA